MIRKFAALLLCGLLACSPAFAQGEDAEAEPGTLRLPPPIYEPELLRLAQVMGSLAFLRALCEADDAEHWPERMRALIEAEGPARAERLAGAYNRGYTTFALTYRICTPSAEMAIARYLEEGERLSRTIAGRYGS